LGLYHIASTILEAYYAKLEIICQELVTVLCISNEKMINRLEEQPKKQVKNTKFI